MYKKYWERGYNVIALSPKSKRPVSYMTDWQKWSTQKQPEEFIDYLEEHYPVEKGYNIGLILGKASNVMVIDNDSELEEVGKMLPQSNVCSRGQKGLANFFQYFEDAESRAYKFGFRNKWGKEDGFDILATSKYILVPPSIHPDTNLKYVFPTGEDNPLNIPPEELPTIGPWIYEIADVLMERFSKDSKAKLSGGRNDNLVQIVSAMRHRGEDEFKITEEIYNYDLKNHAPRLFTDYDENFTADTEDDAYHNAFKFQASVTMSLIKSRKSDFKFQKPITETKVKTDFSEIEIKKLPLPTGVMKEIYDEIMTSAYVPHENYALCGSIMTMAAFACGRYHYMGNHPVVYSMCMAGTGWGKEAPIKVVKSILSHEDIRPYNLTGLGSYISPQALIQRLPKQRAVLDIFDEISSFFGDTVARDSFTRRTVDELLKLYSVQGTYYPGVVASTHNRTGACYSPFINLMGFIQPKMFERSVGINVVDQGFLPRFLIFDVREPGKYQGAANDRVVSVDHIVGMLKTRFPNESIFQEVNKYSAIKDDEWAKLRPCPRAMNATIGATRLFIKIGEHYSTKVLTIDEDPMAAFYTRVCENVKRLSMLKCLSDSTDSDKPTITEEDVLWSQQVIETCIHNFSPRIASMNGLTGKVMSYITSRYSLSKSPVKFRDVYRRFKFDKKSCQGQLDTLEASEYILIDRKNSTVTPLQN